MVLRVSVVQVILLFDYRAFGFVTAIDMLSLKVYGVFRYVCICLYYACIVIWRFTYYLKRTRYVSRKTYRTSVQQKYTRRRTRKMTNLQKEVQTKLTKGLMDMIVLQLLKNEPMHGYQIITSIRRSFGVYLGPSTVYPMLSTLEKKGYVKSQWNMTSERPRKVYALTIDGQNVLSLTEGSLNLICRTISRTPATETPITLQASIDSRRKTLSAPTFTPKQ
jgi:PadR family transcriptional regulator